MQSTTKCKFIIAVLIIILLVIGQKLKESRRQNRILDSQLNDYESALKQANSIIEEARDYAWESYEEMGEALENLSTIDTVSQPSDLRFLPTLPKLPKLPELPKLPK